MAILSILVAVDFGAASARAMAVGGAIAAGCPSAALRLIHAESIEAPPYFTHATLLAAAVPEPRTAAWMSDYGEPLVRFCSVPVLFVPELSRGASQ